MDFRHWHPDLEGIRADGHLTVREDGLTNISANVDVGQIGANSRFLEIEDLVGLFTDWMKAKAGFDSGCRPVTCIFQEEPYPHICIRHWAEAQGNDLSAENLYPRPLIGFHNAQLTLHSVELPFENTGSDNTYDHQSAGEPANAASPARHDRFIDLVLGLLWLAATACFVFLSYKGTVYADNYWPTRWLWWLPLVAFIGLAFWSASHAVGFLTVGNRSSESVGPTSISGVQAAVDVATKAKVFDRQRVLSEWHAAGIEIAAAEFDGADQTKREFGLVVSFAAWNLIIDASNDQGRNHRHLTGTRMIFGSFAEQLIGGVLFDFCHRQNPILTFGISLPREKAWSNGAELIERRVAQRVAQLALRDDWDSQHSMNPPIDADGISWNVASVMQNEFDGDMQSIIFKPKTSASGIRRFPEGNIGIDPRAASSIENVSIQIITLNGGLCGLFGGLCGARRNIFGSIKKAQLNETTESQYSRKYYEEEGVDGNRIGKPFVPKSFIAFLCGIFCFVFFGDLLLGWLRGWLG